MFLNNNGATTEFLAESNLILAQGDLGNKMQDLLIPIQNLFSKKNDFPSLLTARKTEASSRVAFFCEWYFQTLQITSNSSQLLKENKEYLQSTLPEEILELSNFRILAQNDIESQILTRQSAFLNQKSRELQDDLVLKYKYLNKYLNSDYLGQFLGNDLILTQKLSVLNYELSDFLEICSLGLSFAQYCLPCLVGFTFNFHQEDSPINPKGIKWNLLEDILRLIAQLHETKNNSILTKYFYLQDLSEVEKMFFLERFEGNLEKVEIEEKILNLVTETREKISISVLKNIEDLIFPEKYKDTLKELVEIGLKTEQSN